MRFSKYLFVAVTFLFIGFSIGGAVFAQDLSSFPPGASVDALREKVAGEALEQVEEDYAAPVTADIEETREEPDLEDTRPFYVKKIHLEGDLLIDEALYLPLIEPYEDRQISFADLKQLLDALEAVFRAEGYFAVITIPPQRMEDPEIFLKVIVSKMGKLSVEGNRHYKEKQILRGWDIEEGQILRYDKLLDATLTLNQNPNRTVKPVLKAGDEFKTTDIVLRVEDRLPLHGNFTWDNQGVKLTGKERYGFQLRHDNVLGRDDIFLIGTSFGTRFGALYMNYIVPITNFGTKLVAGFSHAQTNPKKEFEDLGINGISQSYSVGINQELIKRKNLYGELHFNFDFKEKTTRLLSITTAWDKARVISFGGTLQAADRWGSTVFYQDFSFGMPNRGDGWALASRGGEHSFFKYYFSATRHQPLFAKTGLLIDLEGQLTPDRLLPQEQYYLGGTRTIRGYPESDFAADQFLMMRIEYQIPILFFMDEWNLPKDAKPLSQRFRLLGFFDQGYGRNHTNVANEKRAQHLMGTGFGVEFDFRNNLSARVEWAWRIGAKPETESGRDQLHFSLNTNI